jgi:hypothetical protein
LASHGLQDGVSSNLLMMTQDWTADASVLLSAGPPSFSHDSLAFDPYDQWDLYDDSSQRQTQADELKLCQLPDWDSLYKL